MFLQKLQVVSEVGSRVVGMTFIVWLISLIPLRILHPVGGWLGTLVWHLSPRVRRLTDENLRLAGYDPERLVPEVRRQLGMQALETAWLWGRAHKDALDYISVTPETEALITKVLESGRPVLFMTPHIGSFESTPIWLGNARLQGTGRYMAILYRIPKKSILRGLVLKERQSDGIRPAPANLSGVRMLLKAFQTGQMVGGLPDQVPSKGEGVWVNFFGKPAYTMTLPLRLAFRADALKVVAWGCRIPGKGWRLEAKLWEEPLSGNLQKDAEAMNSWLERVIRLYPEQYLWAYNRYKCPAGVTPPSERK